MGCERGGPEAEGSANAGSLVGRLGGWAQREVESSRVKSGRVAGLKQGWRRGKACLLHDAGLERGWDLSTLLPRFQG